MKTSLLVEYEISMLDIKKLIFSKYITITSQDLNIRSVINGKLIMPNIIPTKPISIMKAIKGAVSKLDKIPRVENPPNVLNVIKLLPIDAAIVEEVISDIISLLNNLITGIFIVSDNLYIERKATNVSCILILDQNCG
jgi:hypothetical protein